MSKISITAISDLHGFKPKLEGGDLLIVAGDLTARDTIEEHLLFCDWLLKQNYEMIVFIAGNHDGLYERLPLKGFFLSCDSRDRSYLQYLFDSEIKYKDLKIYGSPWTTTFLNWHFMKDCGKPIKQMWDLIPDDVDILITHGPPFGVLDKVELSSRGDRFKHVGCEELRKTIDHRLKKLKLHVFGHVHEGYGMEVFNGTTYINASIMNEHYDPINMPIRIVL